MKGVLVLDKPEGITSFDAVARVRRLLKVKKAGHTGTLDPMATGVLPICLGEATRVVSWLTENDKGYDAELRLGMATDTQDRTGKPIAEAPVPPLDVAQMEAALGRFRGEIEQAPPMYSAVRVDGKRLYELARQGLEVERVARKVTIHALELLELAPPRVRLRVRCSKGTYVRTLVHELGETLGCYAHLTALRRTLSGRFALEHALDFATLERLSPDEVSARLVSEGEALSFLPELRVLEGLEAKVLNGQKLSAEHITGAWPAEGERQRLLSAAGELLAIAERQGSELRYLRVLGRRGE